MDLPVPFYRFLGQLTVSAFSKVVKTKRHSTDSQFVAEK